MTILSRWQAFNRWLFFAWFDRLSLESQAKVLQALVKWETRR